MISRLGRAAQGDPESKTNLHTPLKQKKAETATGQSHVLVPGCSSRMERYLFPVHLGVLVSGDGLCFPKWVSAVPGKNSASQSLFSYNNLLGALSCRVWHIVGA